MGMNPFGRMYVPKRTVISGLDVFKPGFYIKTHNLQPHYDALTDFNARTGIVLDGARVRTRSTWVNTHLVEIQSSSNWKGYQISVPWGLYEKGVSGGDFSNLTNYLLPVVRELATLGKYVVLMTMIWRDFRNGDVVGNATTTPMSPEDQMRFLLPADLATDYLTTAFAGTANEHRLSNYCYAYTKSNLPGEYGLDLKLYNTTLYNRYLAFQQAVANVFKDEPNVIGVTSTESAVGSALYAGAAAGGVVNDGYTTDSVVDAVLDGKFNFMNAVRDMWPRQFVAGDVNIPCRGGATNFVKRWYDQVVAQKFACTASNYVFWDDALNDDGTTGDPNEIGNLRRQAALAGQVIIMGQWQGYEWFFGAQGAPSWTASYSFEQRYQEMLIRCTTGAEGEPKYAVPCNMIVVQRELPQNIWLGGSTTSAYGNVPINTNVPSLKSFVSNLSPMPLITTPPTIINNL